MIRHRRKDDDSSDLELTPMIDVVFILLIFFIVTTSFVRETGIDINRPSATTAEAKTKANILIAIKPDGDIWIDKKHTDIRAVRAAVQRLAAKSPQSSVVILSDSEAKTGILVRVMDQVRMAGIQNISIAASTDSR